MSNLPRNIKKMGAVAADNVKKIITATPLNTKSGGWQGSRMPTTISCKYCVQLDGSNEWFSIDHHADFNFEYNSAFSMSAWLYTSTTVPMGVFGKYNDGDAYPGGSDDYRGWGFQIKSNVSKSVEPMWYIVSDWSNPAACCRSNLGITSGWHHVVMTRNTAANVAGMNIYMDGAAQTVVEYLNDNLGTNSITNDNPLAIGRDGDDGTADFLGYLTECSMWNKELSAAEVSEIYNGGVPTNLLGHSAQSDLISWWRFGDNPSDDSTSSDSDARVYDLKNSHHAVPKNTEVADTWVPVGSSLGN